MTLKDYKFAHHTKKKSKKKESRSHKAAVAAVDFDDNVETFCAC